MAEAEEIRSRIETIKDLSDRLAEQDRTIKDLEEEMRSETPEHPWSFMKMRRHNRLHTEIEDERTSMSRDRYDLNRLTERLFEDVNIIADKATSTNSLELILDLVEQSLDTDPEYRENVRKQAGVTDGMSYMRLVPQDNPKGMLPSTPWGRKAAEEAYRQHQVRQIDPRLRLLRTLATGSCKGHDTPETNDYLALMDFNVGDQVTMGPGLSTTVTTPHWLGGGGILLVIEGASQGVPMVGSRGDVPNESEVFLPDLMHCTVLEETTDGTYLGKRFERIYRLGVDSEETPVPKRELLELSANRFARRNQPDRSLSPTPIWEKERGQEKNTIESKKEKNMAETAQTMTEFTYAPGEKNIVGDRFSPSVIIFWLKTSIAASSTRVQYKAPNTLFGLIPLGASTKTIPLRNIASVDTNTRFNLGSLVWGLIFLFVGFGMFNSNALVAIVCLLVAVANFANVMSATLTFHDPSGGANAITVSILEKDKLMSLAQEIQTRVFTDADQLRHEESMHMAEKQYTAQTNSVLIQQQMLANQQAQAAQQAPADASRQENE